MKLTLVHKAGLIVLVGTISYLLAVFSYLSPPVVALEVMRSLDLSPDTLSLMFAATMVAYGLMQPVSGFWADRFGPRRCLVLATVILGLGSLIFSQAQGLGSGLAARLTLGLAAGLTLMPCMKLAGNWFSPKYFGLVTSSVIALSAASNILTGRPLALAAESFGWRFTFGVVGAVGLVWAIFVFAIVRDHPRGPKVGQCPGRPPYQAETARPGFIETALSILHIPAFWGLGFLYAGTDMIFCSFNALWVGPYLMEVYHQPEASVGNMISLAAISYLVGPPLLTLWGGALGYAKVILLVSLFNVGLGFFFIVSPEAPGTWALYALCFFSPVGAQLTAMILSLGRDLVPDRISGSAMGFLNLFPIIGGAVMQKIIGRMLTLTPDVSSSLASPRELYGQAFQPMFAYLLFTVGLAVWLLRRSNHSQQ